MSWVYIVKAVSKQDKIFLSDFAYPVTLNGVTITIDRQIFNVQIKVKTEYKHHK